MTTSLISSIHMFYTKFHKQFQEICVKKKQLLVNICPCVAKQIGEYSYLECGWRKSKKFRNDCLDNVNQFGFLEFSLNYVWEVVWEEKAVVLKICSAAH